MNRLTRLKSNCIQTLEECIYSCQQLIAAYKYSKDMERCVALAQQSLDFCVDCLDACESAQFDRGIKMRKCLEFCLSLKKECEKYRGEKFEACSEACSLCIKELQMVLV